MKKTLLILIPCFLLTACSSWLDEEPKSVAAETFYNTAAEAEAAVNAPYAKIRGAMRANFPAFMACFADHSYGRGSWAPNSDYAGLNTQNIARAGQMWLNFYAAIRDCNIGISRIPEGTEMSEEVKTGFVAELKFFRALVYFYMVRLWSGVPLRTEINMTDIEIGRNTEEEVYEQIISDLEYAEANLPLTERMIGTPGQTAAKSLLAQVYLQLGRYAEARVKSKEVIESGRYSLVPVTTPADFEKIFGPDVLTTPEEVFYLKNSPQDDNGWLYVMYCAHPGAVVNGAPMHGAGGWYAIYTTSENKVIAGWDENDFRKAYNLLKFDFGMGGNTCLLTKYFDPEAPNSVGAANSFPLIRYTDILMLYAEAETQASGAPTADAMEKLNMVHRRAYGYNPEVPSAVDFNLSDYSTKEAFMDLLIKERGYETMNEGKRWLELVRLGIAREVIKEVKGIDIADKHFLFPIPTTEFDYNKGMDPTKDQNPGY